MRTPHLEYLRLAVGESARRQKYRTLFRAHVDEDLISDIRKALNKGLAPGDDRFKDQIEALTGRRVRPARMGRPKKDRIEKFHLTPLICASLRASTLTAQRRAPPYIALISKPGIGSTA